MFVWLLWWISWDRNWLVSDRQMFPGVKGRCPRWQGWSNIAVNPQFLVGVDTNCFGRNYIIYTLPDETCYGIWIRLYVVVRRCPEHVPVHVIKTVLKCCVRLVRPALYCPEGGCFTFQFLPISRQEQNGRVIRFAERWAGEGLVCVPEGGVTMVECTISTISRRPLMVTCWKYFGAIVLKLVLLKSPVITKAASGCVVSCSLIFLYSSLIAWSVLALGGI